MKFSNLGVTSKVGISWAAIVGAGLFFFYLSKENITQKRYENMKIRERIRQANTGEYERSSRKYANPTVSE